MMGDIKIRSLGPNHNRTDFNCGDERLNRYLLQQASQDLKKNISAVYVAAFEDQPSEVIGFYTLSPTHVLFEDLPSDISKPLPRYPEVPAYRIGRLAVDQRYQGQKIGLMLLMDALYKCATIEIPAAIVVIDAKNQQAFDFYRKHGFIPFPEKTLKLFITTKTLKGIF